MSATLSGEIAGVLDPSGRAAERQRLARALVRCRHRGTGRPRPARAGRPGDRRVDRHCGGHGRRGTPPFARGPGGHRHADPRVRQNGSELAQPTRGRVRSRRLGSDHVQRAAWPRISSGAARCSSATSADGSCSRRRSGSCSKILGASPGPDPVAMAHWLSDHRVHEGRTLYAGIVRIGAGRHYRLDAVRARGPMRWWSPTPEPLLTGRRHSRALR